MVKILICDDEVFSRDAMARIVKRKGFDVFVAATGEQCISVFKEKKPEVVFLDVILPDLDGDHLYKYLKEIKQDVHSYFITGSDIVFSEENAKILGADGYLLKPVNITDLMNLLDKIKKDFGEQN